VKQFRLQKKYQQKARSRHTQYLTVRSLKVYVHQQNNLNALRLLAAGLVLYGHSFVFLGLREPVFMSSMPLGPLGAYIFFTISGYLVTQRWQQDPHTGRFFVRRTLRIFPGLFVCTLLSVLVLCPLVTTLPVRQYFSNPTAWKYLSNLFLYIA
jgi:peptidoglycan/LPS O-acetylase OafA/YrhL